MWSNILGSGNLTPQMTILAVIVFIWSLIWKGLALWKAGRQGNKGWFVAILILNTVGILEILYLYVFSKPKGIKTAEVQNG